MSRKITIFDTTLRDGEQSPGASMNLSEKLTLAGQLAQLNVDVIEAGFPYSSPEDFEAVHKIAQEIEGPIIAGLCRTKKEDIEAAWEAVKPAQKRRIHTFVGTSRVHVEKKLQKTNQEVLDMAVENVEFAASLCDDVEFSAEDAMRTDREYLRDIVEATIAAGATTINIPDTVGYTLPWIMEETIGYLIDEVSNIDQATLSVHCHDDLGLSVANSLAAVKAGAGQIECTINGIGERAGNASLEEIVMAIKTRSDMFDCHTDIDTEEIMKTSRMVSNFTGFPVQPNKAIVGQNAFRHEAGIHQHGVLMDRQTYEIMEPRDVGWAETVLTLGPRSGKAGVRRRLEDLGYELSDEQLSEVYERFIEMADKKKQIYDEDLEILMRQTTSQESEAWTVREVVAKTHTDAPSEATVVLEREGKTFEHTGTGNGPVDAAYQAINEIIGMEVTLEDYSIRGVTRGKDALGEATVRVEKNGESAIGRNASTDVIYASAAAYVNALSRLSIREQMNEEKEETAEDTP